MPSPSRPVRLLQEADMIEGRTLDYGCGSGADAAHLGCEGWDPQHRPQAVVGTFDTILCSYILTSVSREYRDHIRNEVLALLRPRGTAYVSVRRDIPKGVTITDAGGWLEWVDLEEEWPEADLIHEDNGMAIYAVRRAFIPGESARGPDPEYNPHREPTPEELEEALAEALGAV